MNAEIEQVVANSTLSDFEAAIFVAITKAGMPVLDMGEAAEISRHVASYVLKNLPDHEVAALELEPDAANEQDKNRLIQMLWKTAVYFHECGFSMRAMVDAMKDTAAQLEVAYVAQITEVKDAREA